MAEDIIEIIAEQANKTGDAVAQLGRKGVDFSTLPAFNTNIVEVWDCRINESTKQVAGAFILGHSTYGTLGSNTLGDNGSEYILSNTYNAHDYFPEGFWNDRFIDSDSSTGSWNSTSEIYFLNAGQQLFTKYIAKEDKIYKSVKVSLNSTFVDSGSTATDSLNIFAVISGSEYSLTNNTKTNISNTSNDGLKIKIISTATEAGIAFPFTFPGTFGSSTADDINISSFTAEYFTS